MREDLPDDRPIVQRGDQAQPASTSLVRSLLAEHAFKRFYRGDTKSPNGHWEPKKFNASLYDILMGQFATADKNLVMANLDSIREGLVSLMTEGLVLVIKGSAPAVS